MYILKGLTINAVNIFINKVDLIFTHLKLWIAVAQTDRHNFKLVKILEKTYANIHLIPNNCGIFS